MVDNKRGFALILMTVAIVVGLIVMSALYTATFLNNNLFIKNQQINGAYYNAVSGIEYALYIIKPHGRYNPLDPNWFLRTWPQGTVFPLPSGSVEISIAGGPIYTITSTGQCSGTTKVISAVYDPANKIITSWVTQ